MPYNGAGNFVSLPPPQYPAVPGDVIRAAYFNAVINDLIAGLTNAVTRDGQSPATSDLPMAGKKHTGVADATAVDQYATYGQLLAKFPCVASFTALRALDKTKISFAVVYGGSVLGDATSGQLYYYDASDTTSSDNGFSIIVATDGGRWKIADSGWLSALTSAVARPMQQKVGDFVCVFDFMTAAQIADVKAGTLAQDVTTALQNALTNARGRRVYLPKGRYKITAPLVISSVIAASSKSLILYGDGYDANGGSDGTSIHNYSGSTDAIQINNTGGVDSDIILEQFGVFGVGGATATGGYGIKVNNCANVRLKSLWVQGHFIGVYFYQSYGGSIEDSYVFANRVYGIQANQAFNLGNIRRCKCYNNGFIWSQQTANVVLTGGANQNLGVVIEDLDVSYAGGGIAWLKRADATLTQIVVAAGVATATTAAAHGRTTNDQVFITGATVQPSLNSVYPATITVTGANTFTFTTSAPNGTYTESTLTVAPYACGLVVTDTLGLTVAAYSEDCGGLAVYLGATVSSFEFKGGYWQGSTGGGLILVDNSTNGKFGAMYFGGANAGISAQLTTRPHGVDIQSSNTFASGATVTYPSFKLVDGTYYGNAAPVSGTWVAGAYVKRASPVVASPKGWYCTVGGTPGTWVSEGNL